MARKKTWTVGRLKRLLARMPDSAEIFPAWAKGRCPADECPGVEVHGFGQCGNELLVFVSLFYDDGGGEKWESGR